MKATDAPASMGGRVLGDRYRLGEMLGSGGMADVHEAVDERLEREVAVKRLKPWFVGDDEVRLRFAAEARAAASLCHPNVVTVFDTGEDAGRPWIVMERLPGRTLADVLAEGRPDHEHLRTWVLEILDALGAAHALGLVHRDIKPGNILMTADGHAKVADFGIAKSIEATAGDAVLTSTGTLLGTPAYLAPERIDGAPATPASDLYAVGVIAWEALVGRPPFEGATPLAVAAKIRSEAVPAVLTVRPEADAALARAAAAATARDPEARPATAAAMAAIVDDRAKTAAPIVGEDPRVALAAPTVPMVQAPPPVVWPAPPAQSTRRWTSRAGMLGAAAAALVLAVAAAVLMTGSTERPAAAPPGATPPSSVTATSPVASALRAEANKVDARGEPASTPVAVRLRSIADRVAAGAPEAAVGATALRSELPALVAASALTPATAAEVDAVLARVPGVASAVTTTTTTVAPTPAPAPAPQPKGKKGKGR